MKTDAERRYTYTIRRNRCYGNIEVVNFHREDGATILHIEDYYRDGGLVAYVAGYQGDDDLTLLGEITEAVYGENKVPEWLEDDLPLLGENTTVFDEYEVPGWQEKVMFPCYTGWGWHPIGELSPEDIDRLAALERGENDR